MERSAGPELERLEEVMARLRAENGCPWDREQDLRSLRPYLLEEAFEVLDEMDRVGYDPAASWDTFCEELGDLLFQIVFHSQLARERGAFVLSDVCRSISDKLVRRHPHVFGDTQATTAHQVLANWAQLKAAERKKKTGSEGSVLAGVPTAAPALMRAERLTEKASRVGFDWPALAGARAKLDEELAELDRAIASGDRDAREHELGDVLLSVVNVSRFIGTAPEDALRQANHRFTTRFQAVEAGLRAQGIPFGKATLDQMEAEWQRAKASEAGMAPPRVPRGGPHTRIRFTLTRFAESAPWRRALFTHLGWTEDTSTAEERWSNGAIGFAFAAAPEGAGGADGEIALEAASREAVAGLAEALARAGVAVGGPVAEATGFAITFTDPSGLRWRYATR